MTEQSTDGEEAETTTLLPRVLKPLTSEPAAVLPEEPLKNEPAAGNAGDGSSGSDGGGIGSGGGGRDGDTAQQPRSPQFRLGRREQDRAADEEHGGRFSRRTAFFGMGAAVLAGAGFAVSDKARPHRAAAKAPMVGFSPAAGGQSPATQTGVAFLTAWRSGLFEVAANLTDDPAQALAALKDYQHSLNVSGMVISPAAANDVGRMSFSVTAQAGEPMGQWAYQSALGAYQKQVQGVWRWFVQWNPEILYASLKPGYRLQILKTRASIKGLVDRNNAAIDPAAHPSLAGVISQLMSSAQPVSATAGQQIIMTDDQGHQLATVATLTDPIAGEPLATTLDLKVQAAAEAALTKPGSSMVAIEPSTGHILAFANNTGSQYFDQALETKVAPGSTFKIVTSTALLYNRLTTLDSAAPCPAILPVEGLNLTNSGNESGDGNTYLQDFAASCNNAFSKFWDEGVTANMLADTAQSFYGMNQKWDIGLGQPTQYMTVPAGLSGAGLAESLVGQGDVVATTLAMCSVGATVANGSFKQPIIVPTAKQLPATQLPASLKQNLWDLMSSVLTGDGTAAKVGFPQTHFYAKTGTAEVDNPPGANNSWFVVFNDQHDICLCSLTIDGGAGAAVAAPSCLAAFTTLGYA